VSPASRVTAPGGPGPDTSTPPTEAVGRHGPVRPRARGPGWRGRLVGAARFGPLAGALATAVFAFSPAHTNLYLTPWDKADHALAFFALTAVALVALLKTPLWRIVLAAGAAGAAMEVVQGLPIVGRDGDVWDWGVELIAIAAATSLVLVAQLRTWPHRAAPGSTMGAPARERSAAKVGD
jgi:hypothetical protein